MEAGRKWRKTSANACSASTSASATGSIHTRPTWIRIRILRTHCWGKGVSSGLGGWGPLRWPPVRTVRTDDRSLARWIYCDAPFFRSFVLSFFRSFDLSFFRSFVLSFFRSISFMIYGSFLYSAPAAGHPPPLRLPTRLLTLPVLPSTSGTTSYRSDTSLNMG